MGNLNRLSAKSRATCCRFIGRTAIFLVIICSLAATPALANTIDLDRVVNLRIDSDRIDLALLSLSRQAQVQIVIAPDIDDAISTPRLYSKMSIRQALNEIVAGSGLHYTTVGDSISVTSKSASFPHNVVLVSDSLPRNGQADKSENATRKSAEPAEVIVTAQKREERLQDVPVPVTALSANTLADTNQFRIQDYYTSVPGLSVSPGQTLSIRGITTGIGFSTVGIAVDDVPFGGSQGGGTIIPDIDPSDLARVEVLRGPQGTLYGASSMGGLLKFVTVDPSTNGITGRIQVGGGGVENGSSAAYSARGSVNLPITNTLAIRTSGFYHQDPGYIDNPVYDIRGLNKEEVFGGRVAALWEPIDQISLKVSALWQEIRQDGSNDVEPDLGDLQQDYIPKVGGSERIFQAYSVTLKGKFRSLDLTAITGFNISSGSGSSDLTSLLGECAPGSTACTQAQFGVTGTPSRSQARTDKFTEEVRISSKTGSPFEWLVGAFFTHERYITPQQLLAADSNTGNIVGSWADIFYGSKYTEYALFADATYHITSNFDIQVGGRESRIEQTVGPTTTIGPYAPIFLGVSSPNVTPAIGSNDDVFTYLVTPRYRFSDDFMIYARLASGYRPGSPNGPGLPNPQSRPDKTQNYEVGIKADFIDHMLSLDTSIYYIDWKDIQLYLVDYNSFQSYISNASRAKSDGVELSLQLKPTSDLVVSAWAAWSDAVLTQDFPPNTGGAYGVSGDVLPGSSRFSGQISINQEFPISTKISGFAGATMSYVGEREDIFTGSPQRQVLPAYARTDLRLGARMDSWTVDAFVNNIADRRGFLSGGIGNLFPNSFTFIQPRTFGASISKSF